MATQRRDRPTRARRRPAAGSNRRRSESRTVTVVGIPMDLGQSRRGVDMGPSATRYAGLDAQLRRLGYETENLGNLHIPDRDTLPAEGGMAYLAAAAEACS